MIFVSSSCLKKDYIHESVSELADNGFRHIELSGGTIAYDGMTDSLLSLKEKYKLTYRCHNYFPPPAKSFVLNLASLEEDVFRQSYEHVEKAIKLSEALDCDKFGFHAGFLIPVSVDEVGKIIQKKELFDKVKATDRFLASVQSLSSKSLKVTLYIENNVISNRNFQSFDGVNPLLLTSSVDYFTFQKELNFNLLLDIAHLKVSCRTLGLNFQDELRILFGKSDYIHISDNDGLEDSNQSIENSDYLQDLKDLGENLAIKDYTLEVYSGIADICKSYEALEKVVYG